MYRILVVDDEDIIRDKIIKSVHWNQLGFEIAGEAINGREALELVEKCNCDIILTDIKMPVMDGVELIENLSSRFPEKKIVIMSGYNEFEYLRQAIKNKVSDYLLKPTENGEFMKVFEKLKSVLDKENEERYKNEKIRKQLIESLPYMREKFLCQLIKGCYSDCRLIKEKMDFYEIKFFSSRVVVVLVEIDNFHSVTSEFSEEKKQILGMSVIYALNQLFTERDSGIFFMNSSDEMIGICNANDGSEGVLSVIQQAIDDFQGITFSAGISEECTQFNELFQYYRQAVQALKQKVFLGSESVILFKDIKDIENIDSFKYPFDTEAMINIIFYNSEENLSFYLDDVFRHFRNKPSKQYDYVDNQCIELLSYITRYAKQFNIDVLDILMKKNISYLNINRLDTLELKKEWILGILYEVSEKVKNIRKSTTGKLIDLVKEYLESNYSSNGISLELVSEKMNKNPRYLSKVFKIETGENFIDYLTGLRIARAKELLQDISTKLYEISANIGYADVSHFTRVFKKHTGMNPSEFRELSHKNML